MATRMAVLPSPSPSPISSTFAAKKKGASDEMIKEMIDVVGIANQNNKLVEAYQVEVDKIYK